MTKPFPLRFAADRSAPPVIGSATRRAGWHRVAAEIAMTTPDAPQPVTAWHIAGWCLFSFAAGAGAMLAIVAHAIIGG